MRRHAAIQRLNEGLFIRQDSLVPFERGLSSQGTAIKQPLQLGQHIVEDHLIALAHRALQFDTGETQCIVRNRMVDIHVSELVGAIGDDIGGERPAGLEPLRSGIVVEPLVKVAPLYDLGVLARIDRPQVPKACRLPARRIGLAVRGGPVLRAGDRGVGGDFLALHGTATVAAT